MIKNTNADCKIKDIKISGSTAYVTLIIASSKATTEPRVFNFYIQDINTGITTQLSNINYWIDRYNNYNNDSNNVDINLYKQITLQIDITNQNTSEMIDNKWVRNCYLILVDSTDSIKQNAWYSEKLELISKEIILPTIQDLTLHSDKNYTLRISWIYKYKTQEDFNYNNTNLYTTILIKSPYTNNILESNDIFATEDSTNYIKCTCLNTYNAPILIEILLKNLKGTVLKRKEVFYKPVPKQTNSYIKTATGIKKVAAYFIKLGSDD